jgi:uncharacterized cupredoxin-like copper-binding protein
MAERDISKEEVAHTLSLGVSIKKYEDAGRFPKELFINMKRWFTLLPVLLGLIIPLAACGNTASAKDVQITLTDDKITSSITSFSQNIPYHFTIQNQGIQQHEIMIMPPTMSNNMSMDDMDKMALAHISNINSGETKSLDYTFTQRYPAGKLELACHMLDHYQKGMYLKIVVN